MSTLLAPGRRRRAVWLAAATLSLIVTVLSGGYAAWAREGPSVTADPGRGTVGSTVQVAGVGYQLCEGHCRNEVELFWDGVRIGDRVALDASGGFRTTIVVPRSTYVGAHEIAARSVWSEEQAVASFTVYVTLAMTASPGTGYREDQVTLRGTGYDTCPDYGSGIVQIYWDGYEAPVATPPIRDDGTFSATISVPTSAAYRTYQLVGQCRDSGEYATTTFAVREPEPTEGPTEEPSEEPTEGSTASPTDPATSPAGRPDPTGTPAPGIPPLGNPPPGGPGQPVPPGGLPGSAPSGPAVFPTAVAGASSPAATQAAPAAEGAGRGWPRPEIVEAIRFLDDPGFSPTAMLLLLILLAILAWMLIGWPAELFNRTYDEHKDDIRRWLRLAQIRAVLAFRSRLRGSRAGLRASPRAVEAHSSRSPRFGWGRLHRALRPRALRPHRLAGAFQGQSWPAVVFFSILAALAISFAEPGKIGDAENIATILGLLIAVPLVAVSYEFAIESYERLGSPGAGARLRVVYPALALAVLCASVSRMLDFVPGYAYGLIIAYTIVAHRPLNDRRSAIAVFRAAGLLVGLALGAWLLQQFGTAASTAGDDTPFGLRMIDTTLGLITVMSLETLVIGLMPLRFLHGRKLWGWNKYAWLGTYVAGALVFVLVLIGPLRSDQDMVTDIKQVAKMIWLFLGFAAGSFAFWGFFVLRDRWLRRTARRSRRPASRPFPQRPPQANVRPHRGAQPTSGLNRRP